jgi:trehalose synthase
MSTQQRRQPPLASPENRGVLLHSVAGCAFQMRYLLTHPEFARRIGMDGREHVRDNFLITRDLKRWLLRFRTLCGQQAA